jgi:hypothetical protein
MARPSSLFQWCIQGTDSSGNITRVDPPPEVQQTGQLEGQPVFRLWFNQMQFNFSSWLQYFASGENEPVGSVKIVIVDTFATAANASTALGGTWVVKEEDATIGSNTFDIYEKTSLTS